MWTEKASAARIAGVKVDRRVLELSAPLAIALGLALSGCSSDSDASPESTCDDAEDCGTTDGDGGGTAPATDGGDDGGTADGGPVGSDIPCDVADALVANCQSCHADPAQFGATMPLTTLEHFRVPAVTDPTTSVADLVVARINDADRPMPADSSMSAEDRETIEAWIEAGMPGEDGANCEGSSDDGEDPWGPEALPCEPDQVFLANSGAEDEAFTVPDVDDLYQCFVFDSPFTDTTQGIAWAPIIDDARVVHHWLLLRGDEAQEVGSSSCSALAVTTPMIMGWAPGTGNFVMPDEAGLELPGPGEKVILQIHYNNTAGYTDATDRSGVAMCTTEEPRENTASTLWLGSLEIEVPAGGTQEVVSDCDTTRLDEPVNLLLNWPHMHEVGSAIKTELIRGGTGDPEMLVDVPNWNFNNQIYYPHTPSVEIQPGDVLRTTCNFANDTAQTVTFGEGTGDEMCFDFAIVYPITAFDAPNPFGPDELGRYCVDVGMDLPFP